MSAPAPSTPRLGPVRAAHRFDEGALAGWLERELGLGGALAVQQFDAGQSNPTFLVTVGDACLVLRKKPPGELLPKAHMVEREHRIMGALAASSVPVPRMLAACDDASVIGTAFFVMEHVAGRVFLDPALPELEPAERAALHADVVRVLSALHALDPAAVGLADWGVPGNYFERQISRWTRQYEAARTEPIESLERLIEWLPAHVPADDASCIVHGDWRIDNLIVHPREPRVIAVLDWELSTLGHPLADLAYVCMAYHIDTPYHACLAPRAGGASGVPTEEEYVALYCRHSGRGPIDDWRFYLAFSLFRSAAILQGVYKRGLVGNASSSRALALGALARRAGDAAWRLVS